MSDKGCSANALTMPVMIRLTGTVLRIVMTNLVEPAVQFCTVVSPQPKWRISLGVDRVGLR